VAAVTTVRRAGGGAGIGGAATGGRAGATGPAIDAGALRSTAGVPGMMKRPANDAGPDEAQAPPTTDATTTAQARTARP
jgi:hypothetical protein